VDAGTGGDIMTALNWKAANPVLPSLGWVARTQHDGIDIELRVNPGTNPQFCPCYPAQCTQPGVPYVQVTAMAFARVESTAFGVVELVEYVQSVHGEGCTESKPGDVADKAAAVLLPVVTAEARRALAELAGHAARLGITAPDAERNRLAAENERLRARLRGAETALERDATGFVVVTWNQASGQPDLEAAASLYDDFEFAESVRAQQEADTKGGRPR